MADEVGVTESPQSAIQKPIEPFGFVAEDFGSVLFPMNGKLSWTSGTVSALRQFFFLFWLFFPERVCR